MQRATSSPLALLLPALALLLGGCGGFDLQPPDDFVVLEEQEHYGYALRATNAQGVVLAVREVPNEPEGSLSFWRQAVSSRLRDDAGYALLEEREAQTAGGDEGVQLRFGRDQAGAPYDYWVTIFHTGDLLYLVEAGGLREDVALVQEELEQAIAAFDAR